jgi:hypothetical protein
MRSSGEAGCATHDWFIVVAPEAIAPLHRYAALVAEQPVIRLAEPLARQLGLREGQIVQASVQMEPDGVALKLEERLFMLPPGWQRYASGDMRWFQVLRQPGGLALKLLPPNVANPAQQAATNAPNLVSANATSQLSLPAVTASDSATRSLFANLSGILSKPLGFDALFNVLKPGVLESALVAERGAAQWASAMAALRLGVENLSAQAIQRAIWAGGQWSEAMMSAGRGGGLDLKALLRQALRSVSARSPIGEHIESALGEIERSQVESVLAQADQRQVFSLMLPFVDAEPALLRFQREPRPSEATPQRYIIDLHIRPAATGDLWIKTAVVGANVELTVWTERQDVARIAQQFRDELEVELGEAGLSLQGFRIIESARSGKDELPGDPDRPSLDVRA